MSKEQERTSPTKEIGGNAMKNTTSTKTQPQFPNGIFYGGLRKLAPKPASKPEPKSEPKPKIHLPSGTFH